MLSSKSAMNSSLFLKVRKGEPPSQDDWELLCRAVRLYVDDEIPLEKTLQLTVADRKRIRNGYLLEAGRIIAPNGAPGLRAHLLSKQISAFQRNKTSMTASMKTPPDNFTKIESLLFWAHKALSKMPEEKQLINIFTENDFNK